MNRLNTSTSPYLLQHADNPVDWWPWSDEAFAEAKRRDVPVLLSVGYAACHWCHVMAHESFEDEATAAIVNGSVVAIKVDREERPDIDAVYMSATQAMTGQGGSPMTVFMTPDGDPFLCGTYYPRARFTQLVTAVADAWKKNKGQIQAESQRIRQSLAENAAAMSALGGQAGELNLEDVTAAAVAGLESSFDRARAGFGGAPKFPPSMALEFLLRYDERTGQWPALSMAEATCEAMARGGMYDQLGGGFARDTRGPRSPAGWRKRRATSCSGSCARPRAALPPRSTPTATAARARSTSGPRPSSARSSARKTATSRPARSASRKPGRSSTARRCCSA